jgi:hypothetical protein
MNFLHKTVAAGDTCFIPENIIYEFLRVATHPRVFPQPLCASEAVSFLDALFCVRNFRILGATNANVQDLYRLQLVRVQHIVPPSIRRACAGWSEN